MKRKLLISSLTCLVLMLILVVPASAHEGVGGDEYAAADIMLMVAMLFAAMTGIGVMISWYNGEFRNPEQIKMQMLEMALLDDDGEDLEQYALTEA
ncbi:MAG TPA: hypothetical protein VH186_24200 [Chloroflexia bacterium]|nr:hypothetical protein [Chloroflexia bacterium]